MECAGEEKAKIDTLCLNVSADNERDVAFTVFDYISKIPDKLDVLLNFAKEKFENFNELLSNWIQKYDGKKTNYIKHLANVSEDYFNDLETESSDSSEDDYFYYDDEDECDTCDDDLD